MGLIRRHFPALLAAAASAPWAAGAPLRLVTDPQPPESLPPGHPLGAGIDIDIVRQALVEAGGPALDVVYLPWRRALAELETGQADLAPGVRRTPERERFLAFSRPYGTPVRHLVVSGRGVTRAVRQLDDLRGLRVGVVRGYAYPPALLAAAGDSMVPVNDKKALLRMVAAGRFDAALINSSTGVWMLQELGLRESVRVHPLVFGEGRQTQFAVSRQSARRDQVLAWLNQGLAKLQRGGWERFERRYLQELPPVSG